MYKKSIALASSRSRRRPHSSPQVSAEARCRPVRTTTTRPQSPMAPRPPRPSPLASCTGGVQKKVGDRGISGYVYTSNAVSDVNLIGSAVKFRGPATRQGRDQRQLLGPGLRHSNYGQVKVLLDGIPMAPSDNVDGSWIYQTDEYGDFSRNYCGHIGKGIHTVRVSLQDQLRRKPLLVRPDAAR